MRASSLSHLPRSTNLQRCEQNGPYLVSNHSPDFLQVGHLMIGFGFMYGSVRRSVTKEAHDTKMDSAWSRRCG